MTKTKSKKPVAVIISDVHYSLKTLELADAAMRLAIAHANKLDVDLIVAGDLMNDKANMRAEVVSRMIETFGLLQPESEAYVLRGNHDQVNEKSQEHALDFLAQNPNIYVIDEPVVHMIGNTLICFIPYYHDPEKLRQLLRSIDPSQTLIMHQGIRNADGGDYIQDHSAITVDDVAGHRVISGHYHNRQTIELSDGGQWDYVGNPYTLTFGEANDPPKGFQVLYNDGSLEFVLTNLRRHRKQRFTSTQVLRGMALDYKDIDLYWIQVTGPKAELDCISKDSLLRQLGLTDARLRLELIPDTVELSATEPMADMSNDQLLDSIIDSATNVTDDQKTRVKGLWKNLVTKDTK
jgi:DNA repair exonuclease SbcCD nuclease subunit